MRISSQFVTYAQGTPRKNREFLILFARLLLDKFQLKRD